MTDRFSKYSDDFQHLFVNTFYNSLTFLLLNFKVNWIKKNNGNKIFFVNIKWLDYLFQMLLSLLLKHRVNDLEYSANNGIHQVQSNAH